MFNLIKFKRNLYNLKSNIKGLNIRKMSTTTEQLKFIDTHIHIDYCLQKKNLTIPDMNSFIDEYFDKMSENKWEKAIHVCCDPVGIEGSEMIIQDPRIYGSFGVHPHNAKEYNDDIEEKLVKIIGGNEKVVAWGEMGLDYYYKYSQPEIQKAVFERQIKRALELKKPLMIHTREAEDDTFQILTSLVPSDYPIHIHCFTSSLEFAKKLMNHFSNLYFGFTGIVTFKTADNVKEVVRNVPLERILLETDGPFLAPVPYRGKVATSGMIPKIVAEIAKLKSVSEEEVYRQTRINTTNIYGI